jgi:hypothetical protein
MPSHSPPLRQRHDTSQARHILIRGGETVKSEKELTIPHEEDDEEALKRGAMRAGIPPLRGMTDAQGRA